MLVAGACGAQAVSVSGCVVESPHWIGAATAEVVQRLSPCCGGVPSPAYWQGGVVWAPNVGNRPLHSQVTHWRLFNSTWA